MKNVITIFRKEAATFFNSLVGYVVLGVFLTLAGLFFWVFDNSVLTSGLANMDMLFGSAPYLFLFLIPAITMGSFSEEIKSGTIESLMTKPVTEWQIILGKYLAAAFVVLIALLPTLIYYATLQDLAQDPSALKMEAPTEMLREISGPTYSSKLDHGPIIGAYIGLLALGMIFVAAGILSSAITENQVVAFIIGSLSCFVLFEGFTFLSEIEGMGSIGTAISRIGIGAHYDSISRGVLDTRDILYFVSAVGILLLLTRLVLSIKRS